MHIFDYSFLKRASVDADTLSRVGGIERMNASIGDREAIGDSIASALELRALINSVADSNAIEGIYADESRLMGIVSGRTAPRGHDEEEIAGYRDALRLIQSDPDGMDVSVDAVLDLYAVLMGHKAGAHIGFKQRDNIIVERDGDGRIIKVHGVVPAAEAEDCMQQLAWAFQEARDDADIENLLLIPCFICDFLMIHPFSDGNGRMSRLLTTLLLRQEGYGAVRYVSMESKINASKRDYYRALEESQDGWFDNECDYGPFISYFLSQLFLCYRELDLSMGSAMGRHRKSDGLEQFLLRTALPVSKSELMRLFPELSESTVEKVLRDMTGDGRIEKTGSYRDARYRPAGKKNDRRPDGMIMEWKRERWDGWPPSWFFRGLQRAVA